MLRQSEMAMMNTFSIIHALQYLFFKYKLRKPPTYMNDIALIHCGLRMSTLVQVMSCRLFVRSPCNKQLTNIGK